MNNLIKSYNQEKRSGEKQPQNQKIDFKECTCNLKKSLYETEYFLNHIQDLSRYIKLYKFLKK